MLCCLWDLPGPGIELVSPALAGRFFTTEPPGKPILYKQKYVNCYIVTGFLKATDLPYLRATDTSLQGQHGKWKTGFLS